jgi:PhnB protein
LATVSTYFNFPGNTEIAFNFYKKVFGTEFQGEIMRFKDAPPAPGQPPLPESLSNGIMHIALPILGGHLLMGTDAPEQMGFKLTVGNNVHISLAPDTRDEADHLFNALAEGGNVEMPLADQFWGAYFGSLTDQFGIKWMMNFVNQA